jgi:hypothetical protein
LTLVIVTSRTAAAIHIFSLLIFTTFFYFSKISIGNT